MGGFVLFCLIYLAMRHAVLSQPRIKPVRSFSGSAESQPLDCQRNQFFGLLDIHEDLRPGKKAQGYLHIDGILHMGLSKTGVGEVTGVV